VIGREKIGAIMQDALRRSTAEETEVVLLGRSGALTRFANSEVHQNVYEDNAELRVRAVIGTRVGVATTNDLSESGLQDVVERAHAIAARQPENPEFPGLPAPAPIPGVPSNAASTASASPGLRAKGAKTVCDLALEHGLNASGAFSTDAHEIAVANSRGVDAYELRTLASLKTVIRADQDGSGYAEQTSVSVEDLDPEAVGREAVEKALRSRQPGDLEPGAYPVLLQEYAVGDLVDFLGFMGFGALSYQEGHGFMAGRLGQKLVSEQISIWDDGLDPNGAPHGFDYEGVPKQRVDLIQNGIAMGVVYDSQTAAREGRASTGHALPAPNTWGPFPMHVFMATGQTSTDSMLRGIRRGLWITRFWYVNVVHPRQGVLTGMTRDGTFVIEDGELARPVRNLRFTQNVLETLSRTVAVGTRRARLGGFSGVTCVPALHLGSFAFTGVSSQ
jgi:predicted Zn-dependent protease